MGIACLLSTSLSIHKYKTKFIHQNRRNVLIIFLCALSVFLTGARSCIIAVFVLSLIHIYPIETILINVKGIEHALNLADRCHATVLYTCLLYTSGGYIPNPYGRDLGLGYRVRTPSSQEGDRGVETLQ